MVDCFKHVLSLAVVALAVQSPATITSEKLDTFLRSRVADRDVPGVVAMVVDRQSTLYAGAFGKADVARNRPVTPDSIFRIA
jgi:CubicO group peptidase (beta-lactamase class C family)